MPRLPLTLKLSASSEKVIEDESGYVKNLHPDDPTAFATTPRVIAYIALDQLMRHRITRNVALYTYPVPDKFVLDTLRPLRCAETFGWRLLVKLAKDNQSIELIDLSRVENFRDASLRLTLERLSKPDTSAGG